jgi:hypothetical protein
MPKALGSITEKKEQVLETPVSKILRAKWTRGVVQATSAKL